MYEPNFIDKFIGFFDPKAGLDRAKARFQLVDVADKLRQYDAASGGRRTAGWRANGSSINVENQGALSRLRNRSRELVRNNYWAKRAVQVITNHTVGSGIIPAFNGDDINKARAGAVFKTWAKKKNCDWDNRLNFYALTKLIMRTVVISGEVIVRKRRVKPRAGSIPIKLQVQEADVLDTSKDGIMRAGGGYVIQGVEFDKDGNRVAYWLFDNHPGDNFMNNLESRRIPAEDVLHIFEVLRPGQVRGIPFGTTAMMRMKDFDDYEDAQVLRQKIAACFTAFVTKPIEQELIAKGDAETIQLAERLEPGLIEYMNPGETITFATPPPVPEYSTFSKNVLLGFAAAYGITYEALTNDLSGVSFSSARMGGLEMAKNVEDWQYNLMIPDFCEEIYEWFVQGAQIAGLFAESVSCDWTPPRREMIDPVAETNGKRLSVQAGFSSWSHEVRKEGWDPDELAAEIQADAKRWDAAGFMLASDPRFGNKDEGRPSGTTPGTNAETTPGETSKAEEKK